VDKLKLVGSGVVALGLIGFLFYFFWPKPSTPTDPSLSSCPVPPAFHVSNDKTLELGGVNAGSLNVANLKIQDISKFYPVLNDQATTALVVDYLICRSEERKELDPTNADAVNYYRKRTDFVVQTHPTADQLLEWDRQNPAPQKVGKLITPDFTDNDGKWVIVLNDPSGHRSAKIENFGNADLTYVLGNVPEPQLWVYPRSQVHVAPSGESELDIFLGYGANQSEYRFFLQSDVEATPREIVVQVPSLKTATDQQQKLAQDLTRKLLTALPTTAPGTTPAMPTGAVTDRMIETAANTVKEYYPQLDESSRWVTTSQVLLASHWPSLAVAALNRAEQSDASVSQQPALQHYAAHVAYLANADTVFTQHPVQVADVLTKGDAEQLTARALNTNVLVSAGNKNDIEKLIQAMSGYAELKAVRLSLQGDLFLSQHDTVNATTSYAQLIKSGSSLSAALRLSSVQARSGKRIEAKHTIDNMAMANKNEITQASFKYVLKDAHDRPIG